MTTKTKFPHTCEVCGKEELLTSDESYSQGWDYPPNMGAWKIISPRTCGDCGIDKTVWWALVAEKKTYEDLTEEQRITFIKIQNEVEYE